MIKLTKELCKQALMGGLLLGGGGGGLLKAGMEALEDTFAITDALTLLDVSELDPEDIVVTVSAVGAPSAKDALLTKEHWKTAFNNFEMIYGKKIAGLITCENGGISTSNGWVLSAITGIPLIDAPCNGRAHPTGTMGSIGLTSLKDYLTVQTSCGGKPEYYVETMAKGAMDAVSHVIRQSAVASAGCVGVIRNPVTAAYLSTHGAVGAITQALQLGAMYNACEDGSAFITKLQETFDAKVLIKGVIANYDLKMDGGYDIGHLEVTDGTDKVDLTFWNEYMLAEMGEKRVGTFPDLICTVNAKTGEAISTAEAKNGDEAYVIVIDKSKLLLGAGMHQRELFVEVEELLHKDMTSYNETLFK